MALVDVVFIRADLSTFKVPIPGGGPDYPYYEVVDQEATALALKGASVGQLLGALLTDTAPLVLDTYERQVLLYELGDGVQRRTVTYRYLRTERREVPVARHVPPSNGPA